MLQNAYFLAKIGADTAENEQHFAEILPTDAFVIADLPMQPKELVPDSQCSSAWLSVQGSTDQWNAAAARTTADRIASHLKLEPKFPRTLAGFFL